MEILKTSQEESAESENTDSFIEQHVLDYMWTNAIFYIKTN